jgi:hypothetical protein
VFGKSVPREIFGPKGEEVTGEWKELHKELHNLCMSQNIRVIKLRIRRWRDMSNTGLWLKMPSKSASVNQKGRHNMSCRLRWADNIKIDLR